MESERTATLCWRAGQDFQFRIQRREKAGYMKSGEKPLQAGRTARTKVLGQTRSKSIQGMGRRSLWLEWSG